MSFLAALFRLVALEIFLVFPWIGLGWAIAGLGGVLVAILFFYLIILVLGFSAEKIVALSHNAGSETPPGLQRTLARVLEQGGVPPARAPKLLVFPDPAANAAIARSLGSNGLILISQGLISQMSEQELRSVIHHCIIACQPTEAAVTSICAVLASGALRLAPKRWVELTLQSNSSRGIRSGSDLGPLGAIAFLFFLPVAQIFVKLGGNVQWNGNPSPGHLETAFLKIQTSLSRWDSSWNPGFNSLYLVGFQGRKAILPINRTS